MGTLNLTLPDGRSGSVQVGDDFASLSADKQAAVIEDIKASLAPHNSFSADLQGGLHDLGTSVSQGLKAVGGVMQRNGMPEWGEAVSGAGESVKGITPEAPSGPSPGEQLGGAIKNGEWGSIPGLLAHSAVRALPSTAPVLAAGALGGPVAAGVAAGASAVGPLAYERAANNGRSEPSTADVAGALPGAAGEALGGALLPGGSKATSILGRAATRVGKEAAGGAVMDASGQLGGSVGTDQGASLDPYQTAGAALSQGAIGAGRAAGGLAKAGVKEASDRVMARTLEPPTDTASAASVSRVNGMLDDYRNTLPNNTGSRISDTVVANSVKDTIAAELDGRIKELKAAGAITAEQSSDLRSRITNQARRHNNALAPDTLDLINGLDIPDPIKRDLTDGVHDLNTLSSQSFIKNTTGPFQVAGKFAGTWGPAAFELTSGSPVGLATAILGKSIGGKVGEGLGSVADRALGLNTPKVMLQQRNALRILKAAGMSPDDVGSSSLQRLRDMQMPEAPPPLDAPSPAQQASAIAAMRRAQATAQAAMASRDQPDPVTGNRPDPIPVNTPIRPNVPTPQAQPQAASLPPLRVDTPASVRATVAVDDGTSPSSPSWTPAHSYIANGHGRVTADMIHDWSAQAERSGMIPPGTTERLRNGTINRLAPAAAEAIRAQAPTEFQQQGPFARGVSEAAGSDPVRDPARYAAAARGYHAQVVALVNDLRQSGQSKAADAAQDIAVTKHSKADKRAARDRLPPDVAQLIPDWIVDHGGN